MNRTIKPVLLFLTAFIMFGFSSESETWLPVLMTRESMEKAVSGQEPISLQQPGKMYFSQDYLYVVEKYKGVHVIDNSDPSNPINKRFIRIPGVVDISTKNTFLMADNAVDLIAIDISDLNNVSVKQRIRNIFPEMPHPEGGVIPTEYRRENRPSNTIIVNWEKR